MSGYNGWSNYETWIVKLWMDNSGDADYWADANAARCPLWSDADVYGLARDIKVAHEDAVPDDLDAVGWAADLLGAAMSAVNWEEIARHILDDAVQEAAV